MFQIKKLFSPVSSLDAEEARAFIAQRQEGTYTILDVRQPSEYEEEHIPGAKLIPLPQLSDSIKQLDPEKPVIAHCAIGGRSRVAAQMLSGLGFKEVYNLKGGIKAWKGQKATGPQELNLEMVRGDEGPSEIIRLAYGMEKALEKFYTILVSRTQDPQLSAFYSKMIEVVGLHKKMLYDLQMKVNPSEQDLRSYDADVDSGLMEGGFDADGFMEANRSYLQSFPEVIDLAMMLEAQALDLYLRSAEKSTIDETKEVLFRIAEEEKKHLELLGLLLEERNTT
jgi:rhodanese-related sulfurtransferase/rubrerythrin